MNVKHSRVIIPALLLLLGGAASIASAHGLKSKPGNSHGTVRVHGMKRSFRIHIPKGVVSGERLPLVIVLHGGVGCGLSGEWDSRMSEQADKDHFIAAYPNGFVRTWNACGCCGPARRLNVDDVGFMRAMIERMKTELHVDGDRVYVAGISNGGMLAFRLGCELPDEIAAIASIEGCMYPPKTDLGTPISVIAIHGVKDRIIRYDGGVGSMFGYKVNSQSAAKTIEFWKKHDGCDEQAIHEEDANIVKDLYPNGKNGTEVCLYSLKNAGHALPGGRRCVPFGDRPSRDFSATEVISKFFLTHPKHTEVADDIH